MYPYVRVPRLIAKLLSMSPMHHLMMAMSLTEMNMVMMMLLVRTRRSLTRVMVREAMMLRW